MTTHFKPPRRAVWALALMLMLSLFTPWLAAQTPDAGRLQEIRGEGWVSSLHDRRTAQPGDLLQTDDKLQTGPQSAASVLFPDGTALILGPDSLLDLRQYRYNRSNQQGTLVAHLQTGSVRVVPGMLARTSPEMFNIFTPTALVSGYGKDFIVEAKTSR
ncbi:MAG: hypothetical protein RLZZ352_2478 [Pseudomonadota bacterium]|jgi:hypothetical protein